MPWIYARSEDPRIGHIDALILARAAAAINEMTTSESYYLLAHYVHYHTLAIRARRQAYLSLFRHLPPDHSRYLVFTVHKLPHGIPYARLQQLVGDLRPHCRRLAVRLELTDARRPQVGALLRTLKEAGFDLAAIDVTPIARDEPAAARLIDRFAGICQGVGFNSAVLGLTSVSLTATTIAAGVDLVQSDAIAAPVLVPVAMYRFELSELFRQLPSHPADRGSPGQASP